MKKRDRFAFAVLKWMLAPVAIACVAGAFGQSRAGGRRGAFFEATSSLSNAGREAIESVPALTVANATWALGSEDSVRKMVRFEFDRLRESDGKSQSRVFIRFGIIDTNPDGQAAVFSQACVADPGVCDLDRLKEAAKRETLARFVAPGNQLPLFLLGGHPPIPGPK